MDELTHDATSRTLETAKGTLHYHEAGDGPPLLLLHGSGPGVSGWANFRGNLPAFAEHFRTLVLDLPGFGKSYSCEGSPLMAAPGAVLDFLDGMALDSVPIVGNSMGGNVAARIAAAHPDRVSRLVTIGGVGVPLFSPRPGRGRSSCSSVRRGPDPRATRGVDGVDGVRPGDPHRRVRRAALGGGERPGGTRRRPPDVQPQDPRGDAPSRPAASADQVGDARQDRGADADHVRAATTGSRRSTACSSRCG